MVQVVIAGVVTLVVVGFETPRAEVGGAQESGQRRDDVVMTVVIEEDKLLL